LVELAEVDFPRERLGPPAALAALTDPTVAIMAVAIVVATTLTRFVRLISVLVFAERRTAVTWVAGAIHVAG
jgi:drug/metabolite transporter (DMT)-like permease